MSPNKDIQEDLFNKKPVYIWSLARQRGRSQGRKCRGLLIQHNAHLDKDGDDEEESVDHNDDEGNDDDCNDDGDYVIDSDIYIMMQFCLFVTKNEHFFCWFSWVIKVVSWFFMDLVGFHGFSR